MKPPPSSGPAGPSRRRGSRTARRLLIGYLHSAIVMLLWYVNVHSTLHGIDRAAAVIVLIAGDVVIAGAAGRFLGNRNPQGKPELRGLPGVLIRRASRSATPAGSGLMAGAAWQAMRAAARLMPRAAGQRWLAEAGSFLSEAPSALRRRALRNYLVIAPQAILVSWAGHLSRRTRAR